ncbi:hypothetical protein [Iamia sp.]|uniref:hypothetical protein n=1 Tax=Iamia sp. TaxID=2722710 RepID=UPI002C4CCAE5|nr:hypothetical protein [Iamia sp.]HXH57319.1 hypothetical protein [Iamia sp.]
MTVDLLLWDFGDTLVDERWMRRPPRDRPSWEMAWLESMAVLADRWNVGELSSEEVFADLATRTGMSTAAVAEHARECCSRLVFNRIAWRVAREHRRPQAIVTVNPDLFDDVVVPLHRLAGVFDVIVSSATERTVNKTDLCLQAIEQLGISASRSRALLIDNRRDLVDGWRAAGGAGYWFQGDDVFGWDLPALFQ